MCRVTTPSLPPSLPPTLPPSFSPSFPLFLFSHSCLPHLPSLPLLPFISILRTILFLSIPPPLPAPSLLSPSSPLPPSLPPSLPSPHPPPLPSVYLEGHPSNPSVHTNTKSQPTPERDPDLLRWLHSHCPITKG